MSDYSITVEQIVAWLRYKERALGDLGVTLAEVRERHAYVPSADADFDSTLAIGRISAWESGEIDFEVLRRKDGTDVLFRHEKISRLDEFTLEEAYADFLRRMLNPDEAVPSQP